MHGHNRNGTIRRMLPVLLAALAGIAVASSAGAAPPRPPCQKVPAAKIRALFAAPAWVNIEVQYGGFSPGPVSCGWSFARPLNQEWDEAPDMFEQPVVWLLSDSEWKAAYAAALKRLRGARFAPELRRGGGAVDRPNEAGQGALYVRRGSSGLIVQSSSKTVRFAVMRLLLRYA
jgi:hypothetical protein